MTTVSAYYDGSALLPLGPLELPEGRVVKLTVNEDDAIDAEIAKKLAALEQLNKRLAEHERTDPLPPEFDEIMAKRVRFSHEQEIEL